MTLPELKSWLDGYMTGAGDKADAAVIVAKVKEVTEPFAGHSFGQFQQVGQMVGAMPRSPDSSANHTPNLCRAVAAN